MVKKIRLDEWIIIIVERRMNGHVIRKKRENEKKLNREEEITSQRDSYST